MAFNGIFDKEAPVTVSYETWNKMVTAADRLETLVTLILDDSTLDGSEEGLMYDNDCGCFGALSYLKAVYYDEYQAKHREKEHESRLRDMHMNQQEYDEMIAGLPEVQEAKRVTAQAQRAEWDRRIREEIEQVSTLNPAIRSLEDLANDPRFEQVKGYLDRGIEPDVSTATVELAAAAIGVEPGRICKSLSFIIDDRPLLILAEGMARVDNKKYKSEFGKKAKMIPREQVEELIGHEAGGVCPFGVNENVEIYLDESRKKWDVVYPAAGNANSAVKLALDELQTLVNARKWVDVCK